MVLTTPIDESPDQVKDALAPVRHRFSVAVYNCQNAFSVGAIVRVAHSFLAREIFVIGRAPYYEKASMGMQKYESIVTLDDEAEFLAHQRVVNRPLWAFEREHAQRSLYDRAPIPEDVVLLFGSERAGLPDSLLQAATTVVGIPLYGVNQSLPVTVAAGIAMSEWIRRKWYP